MQYIIGNELAIINK